MKQYEERLKINREDIDSELAEQGSLFLHVANKALVAKAAYETFKLETVERLTDDLDAQIRQKALDDGRKVTESAITSEIERHPQLRAARSKLLKLKHNWGIASNLEKAWYARLEDCRELSRNRRKELDGLGRDTVKAQAA